jgi:hypothetical protein
MMQHDVARGNGTEQMLFQRRHTQGAARR